MMVVLVCTQQQDVLCMLSVLSYKFVLTHNQGFSQFSSACNNKVHYHFTVMTCTNTQKKILVI